MSKYFKKPWVRVVLGLVAFYCIFFVNVGTRTSFQHVIRILSTPEAKEFGNEIVAALDSAKNTVRRELGNSIRGDEE